MARLALVVVTCLALIAASASAASRPSFPKGYAGTISGTYTAKKDGRTRTIEWSISKVSFKLIHVRSAEGSWTGYYKVAGGTVTYKEDMATSECNYSVSDKFALAPAMPKRMVSTPFWMMRSMLSKENYGGSLGVTKKFKVAEACDRGDGPEVTFTTVEPPDLFDTGAAAGKVGRALKGRFVSKDDFLGATTTYKWSLKPRR